MDVLCKLHLLFLYCIKGTVGHSCVENPEATLELLHAWKVTLRSKSRVFFRVPTNILCNNAFPVSSEANRNIFPSF